MEDVDVHLTSNKQLFLKFNVIIFGTEWGSIISYIGNFGN